MEVFGSGPRLDEPTGDPARQAVSALRGYAYQLYASGLAWLALPESAVLYLEVAEDYAVATRHSLSGTQVRDTAGSGSITLQSEWARSTIDAFVDLVARNPGREVSLHYLTTSGIGLEREKSHRIVDRPALEYWRRAAAGAELAPLRALIEALDLKDATTTYLKSLSEESFRRDFLQRIHWHCGEPGLADVRTDLELGIIEYAATARRLSSHAARKLTPGILERVLSTVISDGRRALRRADLLLLIDDASFVAVSVEQLATAFQGGTPSGSVSRTALLTPADDLPLPTIYAPRHVLVEAINAARRSGGLAVASGATGLGKSLAARLVAARSRLNWSIADFRHLSPEETAARLGHLHGELAASSVANLILDDLNGLDHPSVRDALARLLVSLRRRDGTMIVTTYRSPANTTLLQLASNAAQPIEVPYLDDDEVAELVVETGGDRKYGRAVFQAAANGHPLMTMAALLHLKATEWSRASLAATLSGELYSGLDVERRAVRERLVGALPEDAQTLHLRISLVRGGFDRDLAITIAGLDPAIPRGGLILDQLVGPWIEPFRRGKLRISPMVEDAADDVLSVAERRAVHRCVAEATIMGGDGIEADDASVAMHHALRSEETKLVVAFAHSVITCDVEMIDYLSPFLTELMFLPTDRPIFSKDPAASAMMRLAQLLVLLPHGTTKQARACWEALDTERLALKGEMLFEGLVLSKLLMHPRAGELFGDWVDTLLRFDRLCLAEPTISEAAAKFEIGTGRHTTATGMLFAGQIRNIGTVARFRDIMERLDSEDAATRERVLSSFRPDKGDVSVLVNHGWLRESRQDGFDWEAAQRDYGASFELAMRWGNAMLASRCAIAQAICIDENGDDTDRAFDCLAEAESRIGPDVALGRARAKIHWRRRDHAAALPLLTAAADAGGQDGIERAFIAREAGISAASLGDWDAAYKWFERAQAAAATASEIPSVRAMSIGLLADTSQAAYKAGRPDIAIGKMRDALTSLPTIDAEGTIEEAHCHRVVRHCVLWLYREITGALADDLEETFYRPGAASNPEPLEAIRSHPVLDLDMTFYMLAQADEALAEPTGFHRNFRKHFIVGPVLSWEISAAIAENRKVIGNHDPSDFVERVRRYVSMCRMVESGEAREAAEQMTNPQRGMITLSEIASDAPEDVLRAAEDYVLSFALGAAMARAFDSIDSIVSQGLAAPEIAGLHPLLSRMGGAVSALTSDREGAANSLWIVREDLSGRPTEFCWTAVWLLIHVSNSRLADGVAEPLVAWIFAGVEYLLRQARFSISTSAVTVPPLEAILAIPDRSVASAARLLLALAPAANTTYIPKVRDRLQAIILAG